MLSAPIKMIISSSHCPNTLPLLLVKILNSRTWKRFSTYGLQGACPNDLLHTGVYMELALSGQHRHALFWETMLVGTEFPVKNQYTVVKSTVVTAMTETCKTSNKTVPNKSTLTTHWGHADHCPAQLPQTKPELLVGSSFSQHIPHETPTSPLPATFFFFFVIYNNEVS